MLFKYFAAVDLLTRSLEESAVLPAVHPVVFAKVTDTSESQYANALQATLVTDAGISIDVSESQPRNADEPMLVTEEGISIVVSESQYANAYEPMLVSWLPSAKVTDVSESQS